MNDVKIKMIHIIAMAGEMSRKDLMQNLHRTPKAKRERGIKKLIKDGLVKFRAPLRPGSGRIPTYYSLTDAGNKYAAELDEAGIIEL